MTLISRSGNGGGFIFRREMFEYLREGEELVEEPFQRLIQDDQLMAFRHEGFWRPMDTLKDKEVLEQELLARECLTRRGVDPHLPRSK